ncbi:MAG: c-type cytochrome [Chitinophagaceae bacterium]|nr:c-type cytochrome [Chitinophagaceae bacterium]
MFVAVIVTEVFAVLFLTFSIRRINREIMPQSEMGVATKTPLRAWWDKIDQKLFTKAVPIEKEADVLLDHDYDGIKELDNALPPWWKYGFYITILVAVFYLFNYHGFGNGKNPTQEYAAEMEKAKLEKEAFEATNKDKIDEKNVPMADAAGIKWASDTYTANCAACHGPKGGGGAGPNLTDDYWIHKGSLNDIYASIKTGYPDKGMQSWAVKFSPKEMSQLASFVKSIHGTNPPGGLPPKGDLFVETATTPAGDSAKAAIVDTLQKVVKVDTATKKK